MTSKAENEGEQQAAENSAVLRWLKRIFGMIDPDEYEFRTNTKFIHWILRANFAVLFVCFTLFFMVLVLVFSPFYILASLKEPTCIMISGETNFDTLSFVDAFTLSWKSLLTAVDVGKASTANDEDFPDDSNCFITSAISTLQFFASKLLFDGFLLAILVTRFMRNIRHAPVKFDKKVNVEYGEEATGIWAGGGKTARSECPVITIRLVNENSNKPGGELLDADVKVMVRKTRSSKARRVALEESLRPFFSDEWTVRHTLDKDSPLLSEEAKEKLVEGKYWPQELNNSKSVKENLNFSSLIVTMIGTSNDSAELSQKSKKYYNPKDVETKELKNE